MGHVLIAIQRWRWDGWQAQCVCLSLAHNGRNWSHSTGEKQRDKWWKKGRGGWEEGCWWSHDISSWLGESVSEMSNCVLGHFHFLHTVLTLSKIQYAMQLENIFWIAGSHMSYIDLSCQHVWLLVVMSSKFMWFGWVVKWFEPKTCLHQMYTFVIFFYAMGTRVFSPSS